MDILQPVLSRKLDPAVKNKDLDGAVARLAQDTDADAIILYGSRARGDAKANSDYDLCIVTPDDREAEPYDPSEIWKSVKDYELKIHFIVTTRSIIEDRIKFRDSLSTQVLKDGIALYYRQRASA